MKARAILFLKDELLLIVHHANRALAVKTLSDKTPIINPRLIKGIINNKALHSWCNSAV